jgi:hypothetical protein
MSKLSTKTTQWLKEAEQKYIDGMPAVTDENRKRLMQIGLDAVQEELQRRAQKKSEQLTGNSGQLPQPIEKVEQLPQPGKIQQAAAKVPDEVKQQANQAVEKKLREAPDQIKNLIDSGWGKMNDVLSAPAKATEQTIPVVLLGWKQPKEMNRSHIRAEARRYFNAVFASAKFKTAYSEDNLSALWSMKMYCNLWALCEAYNQLAKVRFEMEDLLQNFWSYTQANQDLARELVEFLNEEQP